MVKSSDSTAAISEALVLLLAGLKNPAKNAKANIPTKSGGSFSYTYAQLPDILDDIREDLGKCQLAMVMETITDGPTVGVTARFVHGSGEWLELGPLMLPAGPDARSAGSALTYARRYLLCAALNIAADEDDDGERAAAPRAGSKETPSGADTITGEHGEPDGVRVPGGARVTGVSAAANRPGPGVDGEDTPGPGPRSATGGDSSTEGTGDPAAVPPVPEPHEHVAGLQRLASGKALCIYERADGTVCGAPFQPKPTVFTEPVQERADIS